MNWIKVLFVQFLVGLFFFLIFDYAYTKLFKTQENSVIESKYRITHDIYHHTLQSSFNGWGKWLKKYKVCTDTNGFKVSCDETLRRQKHFDIGFIGDSFTEGIGMPFEDTFVGMFSIDNPNLKIANLGVAGYSPTFYYNKLKHFLDKGYTFDHVYIFIDISDIQDEALYYRSKSGSIFYQPLDTMISVKNRYRLIRLKSFIKNNFYLLANGYRAIRDFFSNIPSELANDVFTLPQSSWTYDQNSDAYGNLGVKKAIKKAKLEMVSIYKLLKERNIKLSLGVYPWPAQLKEINGRNGDKNLQVTIWSEFCAQKCENFINMFNVYENILENNSIDVVYKKYYINGDVHFNAEGNRLIFEVLSKLYAKD